MSDFQGALKELIMPPEAKPKPWETVKAPFGGAHRRKNVRPRHKMVVALHMAGHTDVEIARLLGYKPGSVALILKSDHPELIATRERAQEAVARNTGDMILRFHQEASKSVDTLIEIRDKVEAPFSERRLSALAILDRAGYSPVKKQMTMDVKVPINELKTVVNQLDAANEVFMRKDEWQVKTLPTGTDK
jgi:hypothetical protein